MDEATDVFTEEPVFSLGRAAEDRTVADGPALLDEDEGKAFELMVEPEKREPGWFCAAVVL